MSRIGWVLYDPHTDETYTLPVNPYEDSGSFTITKTVGYQSAAATYQTPSGYDDVGTVVFATGTDLMPFSFKGRVYNQTDKATLESWVSKDYPIEMRDDLLRNYLIIVEEFSLSRVRSKQNPFKHEYNFSGFVLEEL